MDKRKFVTERYNQAEKTTCAAYGNTTIHIVKLKSGDVIVEHCICMDPKKFDIEKGIEICKEKVIKRLMKMYEPMRGAAVGGIAPAPTMGNTAINIEVKLGPTMNELVGKLNDQLNMNIRTSRMLR